MSFGNISRNAMASYNRKKQKKAFPTNTPRVFYVEKMSK